MTLARADVGTDSIHASWITITLLGLIVLIGAVVRGHSLGAQCFDCDELYAVRIQGTSIKTLAEVVARDGFHTNHPPLMTVPYLYWTALFGPGETAVRALPFLAGLLTIVLVYRLGATLANPTAGLFAAAVLAINPLHVAYAQEARQYELLTLMLVAAHLFFVRCLQGRSRWDQAAYVLLCMLAVLTHYFGAIALAGHGVLCGWLLIRGDRTTRQAGLKLLMSLTLAAIPCLAWLPVVRFQSKIKWQHLVSADVDGLLQSLPDVLGVRTSWDGGLLGGLVILALTLLGCWGFRRKALEASETDLRPPFPRALGAVAVVMGLILLGVTLGPLATRLTATAGETLKRYGYDDDAIRRELIVLRQLLVAVPLGLAGAGTMLLAWPRLGAIGRRLIDREAPSGRPIRSGTVVAGLLAGPIVTTYLIGLSGIPFLQTRNLIVLVPPLCLGLGFGLETLGRSRLGRPFIVATAALLLIDAAHYRPISLLFGQKGYEVAISTFDWKSVTRYLQRPDVPTLPLLACKAPVTDPILYYQKSFSPQRLASAPEDVATLPTHFYLVHIDGNPACENFLKSIKDRGADAVPRHRDDQLVLLEIRFPAPALPSP
jgi:hypothetical protein